MRPLLLAALALLLATASPTLAQYSNRTVMYYEPNHGTQVEYYGAAGDAFLWYPGNKISLPGRWKTEGASICFIYGPNTYNPVTGDRGGAWECVPMSQNDASIVERKKGDVFGLASGKIPFVLTRAKTTIAALRKGPVKDDPAAASGLPSADELCKERLANAERSPADMMSAATLYYHGTSLGKPCVKVDYMKAFDLLKRAGDTRTYNSLIKDLKDKAATGNPRAIAALQRLGE